MKTRHLLSFVMLMVLSFGMSVKAQNMAIATLQHDSDMKAFYGGDAFIEALEAAQTGDLISLSSGNFNAPDSITKAVIIQGAGMKLGALTEFPTLIVGNHLIISLPENESGMVVEGLSMADYLDIEIHTQVKNLSIIKCKTRYLAFDDQSTNCMIDRCYIYNAFQPDEHSDGLYVRNSRISNLGANAEDANMKIDNCVIGACPNGGPTAVYNNNVIYGADGKSSSVYYNNLIFDDYGRYGTILGNGNSILDWSHFINVISNGHDITNTEPNKDTLFTLTDEAAAKYLGTDGTQVGMYGGATPFTVVPSCPQVTEKEIAGQSDSNGKLSIKITVETPNN